MQTLLVFSYQVIVWYCLMLLPCGMTNKQQSYDQDQHQSTILYRYSTGTSIAVIRLEESSIILMVRGRKPANDLRKDKRGVVWGH